jgi:hypothetical protein
MASSNSAADKMNEELERQQREAAAEAARKLKALTQTRMQIVKSAGGLDWNAPTESNDQASSDSDME